MTTADATDDLNGLPKVEEVPEREGYGNATDRAKRRDTYLLKLDEPKHALEYGGVTGTATIRGMPTGSPGGAGNGEKANHSRRIGIVCEPVPVLMRDAVTIDTAVRLTGVKRETIQRAAKEGRIPVLKLGPRNDPYVVRLRDVVTYLATMWTTGRARAEQNRGDFEYVGFPEWLVREVAESWPETSVFKPGNWQGGTPRINRGGRPQGYSPGKGWTVHGKKLGRPFNDPEKRAAAATPPPDWRIEEKRVEPEEDHSQAPPAAAPATAPPVDPTTLPKWHPLWRRPQAPQEGQG